MATCPGCGREAFPDLRAARLSEFVARHSGECAATFDPASVCMGDETVGCIRVQLTIERARAEAAERERDELLNEHEPRIRRLEDEYRTAIHRATEANAAATRAQGVASRMLNERDAALAEAARWEARSEQVWKQANEATSAALESNLAAVAAEGRADALTEALMAAAHRDRDLCRLAARLAECAAAYLRVFPEESITTDALAAWDAWEDNGDYSALAIHRKAGGQ